MVESVWSLEGDELELRVEIAPSSGWPTVWPRIGIGFDLPDGAAPVDGAHWFGLGPLESYPRQSACGTHRPLLPHHWRPRRRVRAPTGNRTPFPATEVDTDERRERGGVHPGPSGRPRPPPGLHAQPPHPATDRKGPSPLRAAGLDDESPDRRCGPARARLTVLRTGCVARVRAASPSAHDPFSHAAGQRLTRMGTCERPGLTLLLRLPRPRSRRCVFLAPRIAYTPRFHGTGHPTTLSVFAGAARLAGHRWGRRLPCPIRADASGVCCDRRSLCAFPVLLPRSAWQSPSCWAVLELPAPPRRPRPMLTRRTTKIVGVRTGPRTTRTVATTTTAGTVTAVMTTGGRVTGVMTTGGAVTATTTADTSA